MPCSRAIDVQESPVGPPQPGQNRNFPTQDSKDQAAIQAFSQLTAASIRGARKAEIAEYYLGSIQADEGKLAEAEKSFKEVADKGDAQVLLAGQALAGPDLLRRRPRRDQGEKCAARPDGPSHAVRLQGTGHHHAGALPGGQEAGGSAQTARSAAQPARRRRTGGPVGLRPSCLRNRPPQLSCWPPAISGRAQPGAAYTRSRNILTAMPSSATATAWFIRGPFAGWRPRRRSSHRGFPTISATA